MAKNIPQELDGGKLESVADELMDDADRAILSIIQANYPLVSKPYDAIGEEIGLEGSEVLQRIRAMRDRGIIRRMGANFQSRKLGFRSTLCAAKVPEDKIAEFASVVNSHVGVTHNYVRKHKYNIWFTYIGSSWENVCETLDKITEKTGIAILNLPAKRMYKIRVDFKMS